MNYTKTVIREKKITKLATSVDTEEEEANLKKIQQQKQETLEKEAEIAKLQKENKKLIRENKRLSSDVTLLNGEVSRLEERVKKNTRSRTASIDHSSRDLDYLLSPRQTLPSRTSNAKPIIKEVEVEVIKEVRVPAEIECYKNQNYWSGGAMLLEDVANLVQQRFSFVSSMEAVGKLLIDYNSFGGVTHTTQKTAKSINLQHDHNHISHSHEKWKSLLSTGLENFFAGDFGKDENIDTDKILSVVDSSKEEQKNCLNLINEFYDKLNMLEGSSQNADVFVIQQRRKIAKELNTAITRIADQYHLKLPNTSDILQTSSDTLPEDLTKKLKEWNQWFSKFKNSVSFSLFKQLGQVIDATLCSVADIKKFIDEENQIFSIPITCDSQDIPIVNSQKHSNIPKQFYEFLCIAYLWSISLENYLKNQIKSDSEAYRQQQARDEVRNLVSTIETQINQHIQEENEIEEMIQKFHKIKIMLKRLRSSIARDESKLLDYEIMMEEADFNDEPEMTQSEIEQQSQETKDNIEKTKQQLISSQDEKRIILQNLRNLALRGHLLILTNTEVFDTHGFRNELLRGGMEHLYIVGDTIADYEQIESFAKSVAKYQHKQDSSKICVMKRCEIMDEQQVKFFRNELKLLRKMQHPFVGSVHGVLFTKTEAYIQLPFYSGGNLRDRINQIQQKITLPDYSSKYEQRDFIEMKRIFHEVLQALAYLHSQSITHYDVKPENIVFDEFEHPILIDFGISEDPNSTLFSQNPENVNTQIRGSVGYIAPEIKAGKPSAFTSDCYSFGVMLFEAFFDTSNIDLDSLGIIELPRHSSEDLRQLIQGFLITDPSKRFTATKGLRSDFFSQKAIEKMIEQSTTAHSEKKLEAFRNFLEVIRNKDKFFMLNIHRDQLVKDILTEFRNKTKDASNMKNQTVVQYFGESGIDTGGLRRDLYCSFFQEICEPQYGMFELSADKKYYYPIRDGKALEEQFTLFGKILAKTLIDGDVIGDFFPISLFKFLADQSETIDLSDVYMFDKQLYGNLQSMLMQSINGWDLDWDLDENPNNYELIDDNNKGQYILLKSRDVLVEQRRDALEAIKKGFQSVPELLSHLALLSPVELRLLLSGETYIDGDMVLHQFQYEERWDKDDVKAARKNLNRFIRNDATSDQLKLILMLTTASPTIPIGGFSPPIRVRYVEGNILFIYIYSIFYYIFLTF